MPQIVRGGPQQFAAVRPLIDMCLTIGVFPLLSTAGNAERASKQSAAHDTPGLIQCFRKNTDIVAALSQLGNAGSQPY